MIYLPGKNGLDINIIRKHDNQDYNESYTGIANAYDTIQFRYCYNFKTSNGESFYIAFYTEDDMYTYLYKGANLTELDTTKRFTARFNDNTSANCYYFEDVASKIIEETDGTIRLEYDESQPQKLLTEDKEGSTGLSSHKILPNKNGLGDNWRLVLPEAYLYRTYYERDDDMKYNEFMGAFRGMDGVMNSFTGYINAQDQGSIGSKITSSFYFTDNKYLSAQCFYAPQSVDSIPYNFIVKDNNGLTYYFNDTAIVPDITNIEGQDEGNVSMSYKFNIFGYPISQTDSYGAETQIAYDSVNRPTLYTFANGATRRIEYNVPQNYSVVTNEAGVQAKNIYDGLGRISSKQLKDGSTWRITNQYTYDKNGRTKEVIAYQDKNGSGSKEEYTYDAMNRVKTKTVYELPNKKQYTETYYYGIENQKGPTVNKKTVAEDGSPAADQTEYYDTLGRKVKTEVGENITLYTYDYLDRCISQTDPKGNTTTTEYNTSSQETKTTNAAGDSVINTYDMAGQLISQTDPKGNVAFYTYDKLGNKIQDITPFGTNNNGKTKYFYDKNVNLVRQDVVRGEAVSIITRYQYDAMGNLIAVTGNDGEKDSITQYEYDAANRMTRMVTGLTAMQTNLSGGTQYEYNALGYVSKVTDPLGQSEMYPEYDYAGNAQKYRDKNGNEICYEYGLYGLERQTVAGKDEEKNQKYTSLGQVQKSTVINTDGTAYTEQYTYDAHGRLAAHTAGNAVQNYTYDKNSNVQTYTLNENGQPKNSIEYGYNTLNQLTELNSNGIMTVYQYDKNGNLTSKKTGSDLTTTYEYNAGNLITRMVNQKGNQIYNDYECSYLRDGSKLIETDGAIMKGYTYDKMGRLSSEAAQRNMSEMAYSKSYDYDAAGNRVKSTQNDYDTDTRKIINYTYDSNNRMTGKSTILADAPNSQTGEVINYTNYFYDKNGNTTTEQTFAYTTGTQSTSSTIAGRSNGNSLKVYEYNAFNQLTAYSDGSNRATYQYNTDGLRTKKTVNGQSTGFIWNGTNLAAETIKGNIANTYTYDITGIHSTNQNGTLGLYQKNPHGDITNIVNSSGTKLNTYDYDAFGNEFANEETINNPFRYCGEYYDNESDNIYLRARYYAPSTGRFINEDPMRDGINWYNYCDNNPINRFDPTGLVDVPDDGVKSYNQLIADLMELLDCKANYANEANKENGKDLSIYQQQADHIRNDKIALNKALWYSKELKKLVDDVVVNKAGNATIKEISAVLATVVSLRDNIRDGDFYTGDEIAVEGAVWARYDEYRRQGEIFVVLNTDYSVGGGQLAQKILSQEIYTYPGIWSYGKWHGYDAYGDYQIVTALDPVRGVDSY